MPYKRSLFDEEIQTGLNIFDICATLNCSCNTPGWPDQFGKALLQYLNHSGVEPIRTLSLFSGAGGLDIGFHDLGFDIIESVEIETKFAETLKINSGQGRKFNNSKVNCIDIRDFNATNVGDIDFIIGGPPCQTFSAAGRRAAGVLGTTDARGVLFREYVRILTQLKPVGFLFENVYGIVAAQNGEAWEDIKRSFEEVGYKLHYMILDAADYGVPQHRERLIIVGLKHGKFNFPRPTHGPDSCGTPFYNAGTAIRGLELSDDERKIGINGRFGKLINDIPPGLNYSFYTAEMGHPNPIFAWRSKFSDFMYKADPEEPVRTIKAQGGQYTGPLHWDSRYFAVPEYKRLQTFPDDYQINGSRLVAIHQIGNSVPPQLARMLALAIRMQVFGTKFPFDIELLPENATLSFRKRKRELTASYRKKASEAISVLYQNSETEPIAYKNREFYATLSNRFKYTESDQNGDFHIRVMWSDILVINVTESDLKRSEATKIKILPYTKWDMPVRSIMFVVNSENWIGVTMAWKVLDRELIRNNIKADLVQLNGYYQYSSKLNCELIETTLPDAQIFSTILSGQVVSKNLTTQQLADSWSIKPEMVLSKALMLRELAFEIRNHATNPLMKDEEWLLPYKFPTLLPESVQLNKSLVMKKKEIHLDVYKNRSELHYDNNAVVFMEGQTNEDANKRYALIRSTLDKGYLEDLYANINNYDFSLVSVGTKNLLDKLVSGITSETGRALAGLAFLQITIKSIAPKQSIRLHKGSNRRNGFSWVEGIPMRVLDNTYNTPFLREKELLNINKDGVMMTRSLAENYPYSQLYKADMRGPFAEWISVVDALESGDMEPLPALNYFLSLLINRSNKFVTLAEETCSLLPKLPSISLENATSLLIKFFSETQYSARAFEVVIHSLMQALCSNGIIDLKLAPLSQMRSANKKHGNVGDIELLDGKIIVESWDAKFGKPYLYEELSELRDKLELHNGVQVAGFIVDSNLMLKKEVVDRQSEYSVETGVSIQLMEFIDWVKFETDDLSLEQKKSLASEWIKAVVETFARKRPNIAPIDEPCEEWLNDLKTILSKQIK